MIWATGDKKYNEANKTVKCDLEADEKSDVTDSITSNDVDGLEDGYEIERGSSCFCMTKELGFKKSDGTWAW